LNPLESEVNPANLPAAVFVKSPREQRKYELKNQYLNIQQSTLFNIIAKDVKVELLQKAQRQRDLLHRIEGALEAHKKLNLY
jgi:hypothetical protein